MNKIKKLRLTLEKEGTVLYIDRGIMEEEDPSSPLKFTKSHSIKQTGKSTL